MALAPPRPFALSYFPAFSEPTTIRRLTASALLFTAYAYLLMACVGFALLAFDFHPDAPPSLQPLSRLIPRFLWVIEILYPGETTITVAFFFLFRIARRTVSPLRRGHPLARRYALSIFLATALVSLGAAGLFLSFSFSETFLFFPHIRPLQLLWLLPVLPLSFAALLSLDLARFTRGVLRAPYVDHPTPHFLPRREPAQRPLGK